MTCASGEIGTARMDGFAALVHDSTEGGRNEHRQARRRKETHTVTEWRDSDSAVSRVEEARREEGREERRERGEGRGGREEGARGGRFESGRR